MPRLAPRGDVPGFQRCCLCPAAGNNAVEMETTATFDAATDEFVIHTPTPLAQK